MFNFDTFDENVNNNNPAWIILKEAFQKILHENDATVNYSITELYQHSYKMVTEQQSKQLYNGLKELIIEYLENNVRVIILNTLNENLLSVFCNIWDDFQIAIDSISRILIYLDRVYIKSTRYTVKIKLMSKKLFYDLIIYHGNILGNIRSTLFQMISDEMRGYEINREDIKRILTIFMSLESKFNVDFNCRNPSIFDVEFKQTIINKFSAFIEAEGKKLIKTTANAIAYIDAAESVMVRERQRINYYFDEKTQNKLKYIMDNKLVTLYMHRIVEMENCDLIYMFENNKYEDFKRIYMFLNRVKHGCKPMSQYLNLHIREVAKMKILDNNTNATELIQSLINLNNKCDYLVNACFEMDSKFEYDFAESFFYIMEINPKVSKYVTVYFINKLNALLHSNEPIGNIEAILEETMKFVDFLEERDFLESSSMQFVAKMLLNKWFENSNLNEIELLLMTILKFHCSPKYDTKLGIMLKDMKDSKTLMVEFKQDIAESNEHYLNSMDDFNVALLAKADWPLFVNMKCNLPLVLRNAYEEYVKFYKKKHSRRLMLLPNLGTTELNFVLNGSPQSDDKSPASFSPKEYTIRASTFQTCVLLLFNDKDKLTLEASLHTTSYRLFYRIRQIISSKTEHVYSKSYFVMNWNEIQNYTERLMDADSFYEKLNDKNTIMKETSISERRLIKILQSLISQKPSQSSILLKNPQGEKFELSDEFCINEAFSSASDNVSILFEENNFKKLINKTTNEENVVSDHEIIVKSSIVRIMKSAKVMTHIRLTNKVQMVNKNLGPRASSTVIQKQIDRLVESKYLAISSHGYNKTYVYIP